MKVTMRIGFRGFSFSFVFKSLSLRLIIQNKTSHKVSVFFVSCTGPSLGGGGTLSRAKGPTLQWGPVLRR